MSKKQPRLVLITEIILSFFVRIGLNNDHVKFLQGLIENGVELPPLEIAKGTMDLIDGRHRLAAYMNLGYTEVYCAEEVYASKDAMILAALKANVGGALPPSQLDISHTIECLIAEGLTNRAIINQISDQVGIPPKFVQRFIKDIQSKVAKRRETEAVSAIVNDGMTLNQAAETYSVNAETLKTLIFGRPKGESANVSGIITRLSAKFESFNLSMGQIMTHIRRSLQDGSISELDAKKIIEHYRGLVQGYQKKETLWQERFDKLFEVKTKNDLLLKKNVHPLSRQRLKNLQWQ